MISTFLSDHIRLTCIETRTCLHTDRIIAVSQPQIEAIEPTSSMVKGGKWTDTYTDFDTVICNPREAVAKASPLFVYVLSYILLKKFTGLESKR